MAESRGCFRLSYNVQLPTFQCNAVIHPVVSFITIQWTWANSSLTITAFIGLGGAKGAPISGVISRPISICVTDRFLNLHPSTLIHLLTITRGWFAVLCFSFFVVSDFVRNDLLIDFTIKDCQKPLQWAVNGTVLLTVIFQSCWSARLHRWLTSPTRDLHQKFFSRTAYSWLWYPILNFYLFRWRATHIFTIPTCPLLSAQKWLQM